MGDEDDYTLGIDEEDLDEGLLQFAPPVAIYPAGPDGYGDPHPPTGGFAVEPRALVQASRSYDDLADSFSAARPLIAKGYGKAWLFGMADTLYTAGTLHMKVNGTLYKGTQDGEFMMTNIANGLVEVANRYAGTDSVTGAAFKNLDIR